MQAPRKIRASNHRPEPGGLSRYLPDAAALNKPFREYAIAAKIGCTPQTLRDWVRKAEVDSGQRVVRRLACHGSILSGVGASGKPGAVHNLTGDISQNVNFAIKGREIVTLLNCAGVAPAFMASAHRTTENVAASAASSTLRIICRR